MGIGVPGLQWFKGRLILQYSSLPSVTLVSSPPSATTFFSSRVGNVCYFVTPEGVHLLHTSILSRLSLTLSCSPHGSYREATASTKNLRMMPIYMLHSSAQRLSWTSPMDALYCRPPTASGRVRDGHHCVLNIPNWAISTHPVGRFSIYLAGIENRHSVTMWQTSERLLF